MIRDHFTGTPGRRIAVIEIPRARARMAGVGEAANYPSRDTAVAWTTISDEAPESSANFMASVISKQNSARLASPGTLAYTPANTTPDQNVPPWNSWSQPNCLSPDSSSPSTPTAVATAPDSSISGWLLFAGLIGGLASLKYIFSSDGRR